MFFVCVFGVDIEVFKYVLEVVMDCDKLFLLGFFLVLFGNSGIEM